MALNPAQVQTLSPQAFEFAKDTSEIYFGENVIDVASTAAPVFDPLHRQETTYLVALGVNMTIPAPINPRKGMKLNYVFTAAGVFTVTWNAAFIHAANGAAAADTDGATSFIYNGTSWVQVGGALAFA